MAASAFEIPSRLYMISEKVVAATTYGIPCAKYKDGIHAHGDVFFLFIL